MKCVMLCISIISTSLIFFSLYSIDDKNIQNRMLYNAVLQGKYKRTKTLLEKGANPNVQYNGLLLRELTQSEDIKQLLSLYKQDINKHLKTG